MYYRGVLLLMGNGPSGNSTGRSGIGKSPKRIPEQHGPAYDRQSVLNR